MIETIYSSRTILSEIKRSPFSPFINQLASKYLRDGYKPKNIQSLFGVIVTFVRWAAHKSLTPKSLKKKHVEEFITVIRDPGGHGTRATKIFFSLIESEIGNQLFKKSLPRYQRNPSIMKSVDEFELHLKEERGLTPTSIRRFKTTVGQFLTYAFPSGRFYSRKLTAKDVLNFIRERGKRFEDKTLRCDGAAIKCYLRFLYGKRGTKTDLSFSVPSISIWRNQNVIHTITEDEMVKLLMSCDQDKPIGVRDYAVLLLLIRYGLRPIEVTRLELKDISWKGKKISIRGKGSKESILPLEPDVEAALKRYIEEARPLSSERKVFLRSKAPIVLLEHSSAVSAIVKHAISRAGLKTELHGARLLRYSAASAILNRGGNLREVSELLRHSSINTSIRYTRLDFKRLELVPLAWPTEWRRLE